MWGEQKLISTINVKVKDVWLRVVERENCQFPYDPSKKKKRGKKQSYSGRAIPDVILKPLLHLFKNWANHFAIAS